MMTKLLAAICLALLSVGAPAQAPGPDIVFQDSMAQRLLACTGCHGAQGRAGPDGYYPRLAGKPAGYLYNQLRNFQAGRRHYALMVNLLDPLSERYLREIADHFSNLDLPYVAAPPSLAVPALLARGQALVEQGDRSRQLPACQQCHGAALMGVNPFIPSLLGLPRDYLNAQLGAWRTGERQANAPDCMADIAKRLAPDDIAAVVSWLASRPVPVPSHPANGLPQPMPLRCGSTQQAWPSGSMEAKP